MDVTIAVATFGDRSWARLANERAVPSAEAAGVPVVQVHTLSGGLHDARNAALDRVDTEFVVYLDADDELEPNYLDALTSGSADVRAPAVRYVRGGRPGAAEMPRVAGHVHDCTGGCLPQGNWIVIGAMARTTLLRDVGGWRDYPVYEDWSTWLRCHLAGASIEAIPAAVYRAHARPGSRNRGTARAVKLAAHRQIASDCGLTPEGARL